jgi:hypothetical protein
VHSCILICVMKGATPKGEHNMNMYVGVYMLVIWECKEHGVKS